jgi:hypothetical protein
VTPKVVGHMDFSSVCWLIEGCDGLSMFKSKTWSHILPNRCDCLNCGAVIDVVILDFQEGRGDDCYLLTTRSVQGIPYHKIMIFWIGNM